MPGTFDPQIAHAARRKTRSLDFLWNSLGVAIPVVAVAAGVTFLSGEASPMALELPSSVKNVVGSIPTNRLEPWLGQVSGVKDPQQKAALAALLYVEAEAQAARQSANPDAMAKLAAMRLDLSAERARNDELTREIQELKAQTSGSSGGGTTGEGGSSELESMRVRLGQAIKERDRAIQEVQTLRDTASKLRTDLVRVTKLLEACENKPTVSQEEHKKALDDIARLQKMLNGKVDPEALQQAIRERDDTIRGLNAKIAKLEKGGRPPTEPGTGGRDLERRLEAALSALKKANERLVSNRLEPVKMGGE